MGHYGSEMEPDNGARPAREDKLTVWQELSKLNTYCSGLDQRLREVQDGLSKVISMHHELDARVGNSSQKFDGG